MGTFDKFADTPDQIRKEGQEITIRFNRTGATTGRISWNIPSPNAGCASGVAAYNGIVITLAKKAANYLTTSPTNGTFYTADNTGDDSLHTGDKIDGVLVVAALYDDRTTTYIDVTDLTDRTAYYVSGYAVDNVARYHREGVHAYSLPSGIEVGGTADKAAKHDIAIDVLGGVTAPTATGLLPNTTYTMKIKLDRVEHTITLKGEDIEYYGDLVSELNEALSQLGDVYASPLSPHTGELYIDRENGTLARWNGSMSESEEVLLHGQNPEEHEDGAYWYKKSDKVLKKWSMTGDEWVSTNYIATPFDPSVPSCDQTWFDGTNVFLFKKTHWEKLYTYTQVRNPLMAPLLSCDTYWFDETLSELSVWDLETKSWTPRDAIYANIDPNSFISGNFWYNETAAALKRYTGTAWVTQTDVLYFDTAPANNAFNAGETIAYVYVRDTQKLYGRDEDMSFVEIDVVSFHVDPADRALCKLWWNSDTNAMKYWDELSSTWVTVDAFVQSALDPSLPQPVVANSAWYNPETQEIKLIFQKSCKTIFPIRHGSDPRNFAVGAVWLNTATGVWGEWNGTEFVEFSPMVLEVDPYGTITFYWLNTDTDVLSVWDDNAWHVVPYVTKPTVIAVGRYWFDSANDSLFMWDGRSWVISLGVAAVEMIPAMDAQSRTVLSFYTRDIGCASTIEVVADGAHLLSKLTQPIIYMDPVSGSSGMSGGDMYRQLGVGDDGSPDDRRTVHNDIRNSLGAPAVQAELTKEQLDLCINNALMELRKKSSYSYKRGFFFLDLKPHQQTYVLTNRCVGFNKIVGIHAIYRVRSAMLSTAVFSNDAFAYGALQKMYSSGTFDILTYHLVAAYMEELETLFAARIMFSWHERQRELGLHQNISAKERVLLDAYIERTEQDLLTDRQTAMWLRRWAIAEAKKILSQTRGKFTNLPGPNGSTSLNGAELAQQANDEMELLRAELDDHTMQDLNEFGMRAHFFIG